MGENGRKAIQIDQRKRIYNMTREQAQILRILQVFSEICRANGLSYYLAGGTLLGAVRHRGFIPWDDDIDVIMPWEDYQRFIRLRDVLPDGFVLQSPETDERYPLYFAKVCDTRIPFRTRYIGKPPGIYIDIFPIVPSGRPTHWRRAMYNAQHMIVYVLQVREKWQDPVPYKKGYARLAYRLLDLLPRRQLRTLQSALLRALMKQRGEYLFSPGGAYKADKEFYPQAWFADSVDVCFEGKTYPAPVGWREYLTQFYGDFMRLPPEDQRHSRH